MADSSFFKNNGTSTQLQGSASASAAAALASEQAALASQTAASTSETNSAASAAASATSAAQSLASANSSAASQSNAATSEANALASSTNAQEWAVKTTGLVDSTDYASKAWAIGGTGVTGGDGASKEWSTHLGSTVDGAEYSAKHYSQVAASEATDAAADAVATAADRVQTGLDVVAAAGSASAASTSQIAAASSAAAAAATLDTFDDRYLGSYASDPTVDNDGNALVTGALYFNTTANEMRVYDGGNWIAASSAGGASLINYHYTATAAQTTFSGSDDNSNTLSYTVDNLIVTRNGVVLEDATDYTATNGTSIVLAVAAAANDEINVVAFKSFTTADMVSATNGGTFQGNVDFAAGIDVTGNVTVTGTVDGRDVATDGTKLDGIEAGADVTDATNVAAAGALMTTGGSVTGDVSFGDNDKAIFGAGSDLQIYHTGTKSVVSDQGTGNLQLQGNDLQLVNATDTATYLYAVNGSFTKLYHNNSEKLATTATGVDVTGTVTADGLTVDGSFRQTGATAPFEWTVNAGATDYYKLNSVGYSDNIIVATAAGNVGIGTSSPSAKLHLGGTAPLDSIIRQDSTVSGTNWEIGERAAGKWQIFEDDTDTVVATFQSNGSVGIGTSSPSSYASTTLEIKGSSTTSDIKMTNTTTGVGNTAGYDLELNGNDINYVNRTSGGNQKFWTNSTERLRIDSAGRVTMPSQPSFYAYGTGAYQAQSGSFAYSSTNFNTGGHYNTATYRFTAPVAGLYYFSAAAIMSTGSADGGVVLVVNGTFRFAKDYTNGAGRSSNVSSVIYLNANDYVFVDYEGNNTWYLTDGYGFFSGCLIG